jgi:hypothetical protein
MSSAPYQHFRVTLTERYSRTHARQFDAQWRPKNYTRRNDDRLASLTSKGLYTTDMPNGILDAVQRIPIKTRDREKL